MAQHHRTFTPKKGSVTLLGADAYKNRKKFLENLFFLEDSQRLYENLSAKEHFQYVKDMWHSPMAVDKVIKLLKMENYEKKKVGKMSLGMKQHVLLGMYLISEAKLLLFDEPLNGLDPTSIKLFTKIFSKLREQGRSIIMSSHQLGNVTEMSDRVMFLKDGKIVIYSTAEIDLNEKYRALFTAGEDDFFETEL
nr:ABC transporter ATP-binding protein [Enterococcus nangangensis]